MSRRLLEVAGVKQDLAEHYEVIQLGGQPDAAVRMLFHYHQATDQLCDWPYIGRVFETDAADLQDIRVRGLRPPFEAFQVFYKPEQELILILAVLHATVGPARRADSLRGRIADRDETA